MAFLVRSNRLSVANNNVTATTREGEICGNKIKTYFSNANLVPNI